LSRVAKEVAVLEVVPFVAYARLNILSHAADERPVGKLSADFAAKLLIRAQTAQHHTFGEEYKLLTLVVGQDTGSERLVILDFAGVLTLDVLVAVAAVMEAIQPRGDRGVAIDVIVVGQLGLVQIGVVGVVARAGIEAGLAPLDRVVEQILRLA